MNGVAAGALRCSFPFDEGGSATERSLVTGKSYDPGYVSIVRRNIWNCQLYFVPVETFGWLHPAQPGEVRIPDIDLIRKNGCECSAAVRDHYHVLFGTVGGGGVASDD